MDDLFALTERAQAHHFWYHGFRSYIVPILAELARGRDGLRLADCGCGTGHNLALLGRHGRAVGFDLAAGALVHARARGMPVARADGVRAPFADDTFDIATSFDVMQCAPDDVAVVREMARIVRPGGAVLVTMAAFEALRGDHAEAWQEQRRYTRRSAAALVERAGLRVERLQFMFASLAPLMLAVRTAQRLRRPVRGPRRDSDIRVPSAAVNAALTMIVCGEAALARRVRMPLGSSILVVGRK